MPAESLTPDQLRVIEKGPPEDAVRPTDRNENFPSSLQGVYNHQGQAVRVSVKANTDELWLSSYNNTQKIQLPMISDITSQPILLHPGYLVVTLHLGQSNKYNIYFFPRQYFNSFKRSILPTYEDFGFW